MGSVIKKSFDAPDEQRKPDKTTVDVVDLAGVKAARMTFEAGWKWSECVKPVAGTDSCQSRHIGVVAQGSIHIVHDDGTESDAGPGDAYLIEPGHDAWVVGDERFVGYEFDASSAASYAKG
jgi:hypothetical protein